MGLQEMLSPDRWAGDSGGSTSSSDAEQDVSGSDKSSQFCAHVSDSARKQAAQMQGWGMDYSMDIRDTRRARHQPLPKRLLICENVL